MMKKRILTISLTLLFIVSTTGLPIYSHYCEMMKNKSLFECEVCKSKIEKVETSCCSEETSQHSALIKSQNPVCCQDEIVYHKVEDEFVNNKSETKNFVTIHYSIVASVSPADFTQNLYSQKYLISSSPPIFFTNNIYLNNSVFLI